MLSSSPIPAMLRFTIFTLLVSLSLAAVEPDVAPLKLAAELSKAISGDDDVAAAQQLTVVRAMLARSETNAAEQLSRGIPDYRSGVALCLCAESLLAKGESPERARKLAEEATRLTQRTTPAGANAVRKQQALVLTLLGDKEAASKRCTEITDKETRTAAQLLCNIAALKPTDEFDLDHWQKEIQIAAERAPFPPAVEAAARLGRLGLTLVKTAKDESSLNAALKRIEQADKLASLALVSHAEAVIPIAMELLVTKQSRIANRLALQAASEVRQMPAHYDLKPILSAQLARYWQLSGKEDGARSLLEQGEALIADLAPMDQPRSAAWIATGWWHLGDRARATKWFTQALETAEKNPNPRMRTIAGIEVCLAHDSLDERVPASMTTRIRALAGLP